MAYHSSILRELRLGWLSQFGWSGVDLFFVLSGFLITGILLETKDSPGYFLTFYYRRALRIWPMYYLVLLAVSFGLSRFSRELQTLHTDHPWGYYALYLQNLVFDGRFPMQYTWSLAVEEHFYLVWPFLVRFLPRRHLVWLASAILVLSPLSRWWAADAGVSWAFIYTATVFRLDGLAAGAILAIWLRSDRCSPRSVALVARILLGIGIPGAAVFLASRAGLSGGFGEYSPWVYTFLCAASSGALLFALSVKAGSLGDRLLGMRWLRYVGKISYGIYLTNNLVLLGTSALLYPVWVRWGAPAWTATGMTFAVQAVLVIGVPSLTWYFFERPILGLKSKLPYRPRKSG